MQTKASRFASFPSLSGRLAAVLLCFLALAPIDRAEAEPAAVPAAATLDNAGCLKCHDGKKKLEAAGTDGGARALVPVSPEKFGKGMHASLQCVACHRDIADNAAPHQKTAAPKADCAQCHEALWEAAKTEGQAADKPWLENVVKNIEAHGRSFHARKNKDEPTQVNATCHQCHDTHYFNVPPKKSAKYGEWRIGVPALCGEKCHEEQLETFQSSVHGKELLEKRNAKAAICIDCHTSHEIGNTSLAAFKLLNVEECGDCHIANLKTYRDTYHGQATQLGDVAAAKCFNCHGSHEILPVDDAKSKVHADNRLKTCKSCHDGKKAVLATAGFVSYGPHAHAGDFARHPQLWIASRFMLALLVGVFAFFWAHSGLWYYREWKDRREGKPRPHIRTAGLELDESKHVRRFGIGWRIAHLAFALVTMTLVLTGTSLLYANTAWAPVVVKALGGAKAAGLIHRVAAVLFIGIFFVHFVYVMYHLVVEKRGRFKWFGPDSLIPRWQDFKDCWGMFKWFVGKGPRPAFDRWAYFEKFDYWAVFWGVSIIGASGLMLAFPNVTATFLPGWVFNVATLVHGEEAFLAAVFLFTVHFFNNHFRPDKLPPPDIVMFTGVQSLEEFRRDHPAQYNRLVEHGELEKYLVDAPSRPMTVASKILGLVLIGIGLTLLVLVGLGFVQGAGG